MRETRRRALRTPPDLQESTVSLSTTIKTIQDIMRKDAGVDGDAQRIGQLVWMLFLKIFDDLEIETELEDDDYKSPDSTATCAGTRGPTRTSSARTPRPATSCSTSSTTPCSRR